MGVKSPEVIQRRFFFPKDGTGRSLPGRAVQRLGNRVLEAPVRIRNDEPNARKPAPHERKKPSQNSSRTPVPVLTPRTSR
jgi:hypothetical protein